MDLLDTIDGIEQGIDASSPEEPILREHRKFETAKNDQDKLKRLNRIKIIVQADTRTIPTVMELLLQFRVQGAERELVLEVREVCKPLHL